MYSVLIVEDHDRLREQLGQFYEQEGYKVTTAACGEEGLQKLTQEKFVLVVSAMSAKDTPIQTSF
jgi:CheY-like chemotaxis protein